MRLPAINTDTVRKAITLFLEVAYPDNPDRRQVTISFEGAHTAEDLIGQFSDESHYTEDELSHRYILRLGNYGYPHMKLVLEEFFVKGEYFFTVDSHDGMVKLRTTSPDYQAWQAVRNTNTEIKRKIEFRWQAAQVPTFKDLRAMIEQEEPGPTDGKAKILIVEDELDVAETTRAILTVNGFNVDVANDGEEALEKIKQSKPDVVLLDIMLPGLDGYEVCSRIKKDEATKDLPVLLVTAGTGEMIATREADGFLVKPFKQEILLSFINHLLNPITDDNDD